MKLVAAGEYVFPISFAQRVAHHGLVFVSAEDQSKRRLVALRSAFLVIIIHIQLKLTQILMREFAYFQIKQHEAFQDGVIENEVNVEMIAINCDPFLPGNECKAFAQFQQERSQVVDERLFQIRFDEFRRRWHPQEFHHGRVFEYVRRLLHFMPLCGQRERPFLPLLSANRS